MRALGFDPEDFEGDELPVWPENWPAVCLLLDMGTQWRTGINGPIGLDYTPVLHQMDRMHLAPADYDALFSDLRTLEGAALAAMQPK